MGVPGLWDVLRPTGRVRALAHLAVEDGFVANAHGHRAYRVGIDASIWFFHALGGREGENPELRTLFFRCARLLAMPFLPIFVFDGPGRPKIKRGKVVGGKEHWLVNSLRIVLDAFGFECRTAPGEAEAELAFLNRVGAIDAVLSDDVDCFIFGAITVMRNGSSTLSGNRAHTTVDAQHVYVYSAEDIVAHPAVGLSQGGLILIALLRGGDYDGTGIVGCGISTAHALARAGFGDTLLAAARAGPAALAAFLPTWRAELREELRTNASGLAPHKCPSIAQRITDEFPSLEVLRCYTCPLTSERAAGDLVAHGLGELWNNSSDVGKIAHVCERFFEWGFEEVVVKRFRTVIWPGAVLRTLLRAALERDKRERGEDASSLHRGGPETPSKVLARSLSDMALVRSQEYHESDNDLSDPNDHEHGNRINAASLIKTIHSTRRHASTDHMLEYRVEVHPRVLVTHTRAGMQGLRVVNQDSAKDPGLENSDDDEDGKISTQAPDPDSTLRIWMPAPVVEYACPWLVKEFEAREAKKVAKKGAKTPRKALKPKAAKAQDMDEESDTISFVKPKVKLSTKVTAKLRQSPTCQGDKSDHDKTKEATKTTKATEGRRPKKGVKESVSDLTSSKTKKVLGRTLHKKASSKSLVELLDEDPFLISTSLSPISRRNRPEPVLSDASPPTKPRPFPLSLDVNNDTDQSFSCHPARGRRLPTSSSSSDSDTASVRFKKSPRKSTTHTSPQKTVTKLPPPRVPSPSPMRPLQRARMKPPQIARPVASKAPEDVIVISSDSDTPAAPVKARPRAQRPNPSRNGGALALSNNLTLVDNIDVIDLT